MAGNVDHGREPCPDRILDDAGAAFGMGAVGGGVWHFGKGMYNSPRGLQSRLTGGLTARSLPSLRACQACTSAATAAATMRFEAPRLGGSFAVWGCLFSAFDCTMVAVRKKEDPWNAIASGALTGGFLQLRHGLAAAGKSAAFGGVLLAGIEGIGIMITRLTAPPPPPGMEDMLAPAAAPGGMAQGGLASAPPPPPAAAPAGGDGGVVAGRHEGGGWFGGMFGGAKKEAAAAATGSGAPPMPDFGVSMGKETVFTEKS